MPDGANKGSFVQGYNAQIAVDDEAQIIVAADVVQSPNDKQLLEPMLEQVERNVGLPQGSTADAGDDGEATIEKLQATGIELLVPPDRQVHGERAVAGAFAARAVDDRLDALQAANRSGCGAVSDAQGHRGAGVGVDQGRARVAPILACVAWPRSATSFS
jgi:hypothetical protein